VKEVEVCFPSLMKPDADCGKRIKTLTSEEHVPKEDDTWWQRGKIDIRDGLLATELTPPQYIQERFGLAIPDSVQGFARTEDLAWARVLGAGFLPTQKSTGEAPVQITSPRQGQRLRNVVEIEGKAASEGFIAYRVEFGQGDPPLSWTTILRSETPQEGGGLALWNTDGLPDGEYTLRLVLEDRDRGELSTYIVVRVGGGGNGNGGGGGGSPNPTPTPVAIFPGRDD
jgi:hypothetical protein